MSTTIGGAAASSTYAPPASANALAEAIGRIVTGRPLPAHLRPEPVAHAVPATLEEGILRILTAHCPRPTS